MFRDIILENNWTTYNNTIEHNIQLIGNVDFPKTLKTQFAKLIAIFPLSEKEYNIFKKLDKYERAGFLSKYLVKVCVKRGINKNFIDEYYKIKNQYKKVDKLSEVEKKDRIQKYLEKKDYNRIINIYKLENDNSNKRLKLIQYTNLLIKSATEDFMKEFKKRNKKEKSPLARYRGIPSGSITSSFFTLTITNDEVRNVQTNEPIEVEEPVRRNV